MCCRDDGGPVPYQGIDAAPTRCVTVLLVARRAMRSHSSWGLALGGGEQMYDSTSSVLMRSMRSGGTQVD